ncbi:hypothetical protein L226DRAFT_564136 [Lentinus tigrinus ALCF2SS1-7]|uniref:uncharacterized protein n=1 Tax=Lentinus tigrinus ALCF2SS1-7 TaxID=1328758 RepID=UPI001165E588|nr:hypothetical protein L226DRAFT_564136 [Lentinus tigrinus ALCF2SS1-7]
MGPRNTWLFLASLPPFLSNYNVNQGELSKVSDIKWFWGMLGMYEHRQCSWCQASGSAQVTSHPMDRHMWPAEKEAWEAERKLARVEKREPGWEKPKMGLESPLERSRMKAAVAEQDQEQEEDDKGEVIETDDSDRED